ncbi:MAG TPA: VOC family protein [Bryobacteraceae bacterium]|nr:VOC family protein [Bryobacteraceae bacterium]
MLATTPLIAFVLVSDRERGRNYYEKTLGLRVTGEDPYGVVFDAGGTMLRMTVMPGFKASENGVLGWNVKDIRATAAALREAGITFERYSFLPQDEDGIWTGDDGTQLLWFKDPDNNILSIAQFAS